MSGEPHEIVIIKRHRGGHEDEHHGGVWKIAFADFMTAMMAFFLVMWLISANDKTKAVIARYFNPVQLVDSTPQPKGLEDPKAGSPSIMPKSAAPAPEPKDKAEKAEGKAGKDEGAGKGDKPKPAPASSAEALPAGKPDEAGLFRDPYAVLAEIAGKTEAQMPRDQAKTTSDGSKGGAGAVGRKGGDAFRDPFEPLPAAGQLPTGPDEVAAGRNSPEARPPVAPEAASDAKQDAAAPKPNPAGASVIASSAEDRATPLEARIDAAVKQAAQASPAGAPRLDVHKTREGTVIDLTDGTNFAMFASASAQPAASMVALMEKIGRLLKGEKGLVTIRGFTDGRPFRSDTYDNWRLSSARAHMAHYMLVRGGLDESRIEGIEGYADRQLKNPKDPGAAENRRIEIVLRNPLP